MGWKSRVLGACMLLPTTACFHQVVQTGRPAGTTVVEEKWVSTWIFGLVEAKPIDARAKCPSGVATIETQTSFLNGLLGALTIGIWDPQTVTITCAAKSAMLPSGTQVFHVAAQATDAMANDVMQQAIVRSAETGSRVAVQFDTPINGQE